MSELNVYKDALKLAQNTQETRNCSNDYSAGRDLISTANSSEEI